MKQRISSNTDDGISSDIINKNNIGSFKKIVSVYYPGVAS